MCFFISAFLVIYFIPPDSSGQHFTFLSHSCKGSTKHWGYRSGDGVAVVAAAVAAVRPLETHIQRDWGLYGEEEKGEMSTTWFSWTRTARTSLMPMWRRKNSRLCLLQTLLHLWTLAFVGCRGRRWAWPHMQSYCTSQGAWRHHRGGKDRAKGLKLIMRN